MDNIYQNPNQEPLQQNQPNVPEEPKKTNSVLKIVIVVIILLIVGGAYLYYESQKDKNSLEEFDNVTEKNLINEPVVSKNSSISNNVFKSEVSGFSFRYPEDWSVKEYDVSCPYLTVRIFPPDFQQGISNAERGIEISISPSDFDEPLIETLREDDDYANLFFNFLEDDDRIVLLNDKSIEGNWIKRNFEYENSKTGEHYVTQLNFNSKPIRQNLSISVNVSYTEDNNRFDAQIWNDFLNSLDLSFNDSFVGYSLQAVEVEDESLLENICGKSVQELKDNTDESEKLPPEALEAQKSARDSGRVSDIHDIQIALELYFDYNHYKYPNSLYNLTSQINPFNGEPYLKSIPTNPTPGGMDYEYKLTKGGDGYILKWSLEKGYGDYSAGIQTVTEAF